ncbi:MAG TPA: MFS transporter [Thermoleophilia bacterium]|nr:MFS transporter [Thermoleophilia bacterium]
MAPLVPTLLRTEIPFRRFWTGQTVSLIGDQITLIALPLVAVLVLHADAAQMGYLTAAGVLPNLLFALHAGAWVDRRGRRRQVMIAADAGRAVLLAVIPLSAVLGVLSLTELYAVAFLVGTASVFFMVAYQALFVSLVSSDRYVEGNSLLNGSRALSQVAGPSLGGLLVQLLTAPGAIAVDAISFVVSAVFLARISPVEPPTEHGRRSLVLAGVRFIARSPLVGPSLAATATINFFNFAFFALFVLYATRALHVRPAALGLVLGCGAVGGLVGAAVTGRLVRRLGIGRAFMLGCVVFPAPLVLVPLAGGPRALVLGALFAAEFGAGLGVMILDISVGSIFAAVIPDRLRSRVSGAYMTVNYGVRPLGALAAGALAGLIGVRSTLLLAVLGALLGVLWLLPSPMRRLRELPARDGEALAPDSVAADVGANGLEESA